MEFVFSCSGLEQQMYVSASQGKQEGKYDMTNGRDPFSLLSAAPSSPLLETIGATPIPSTAFISSSSSSLTVPPGLLHLQIPPTHSWQALYGSQSFGGGGYLIPHCIFFLPFSEFSVNLGSPPSLQNYLLCVSVAPIHGFRYPRMGNTFLKNEK